MKCTRPKRQLSSGMTLIELLVVMAILVLLAGLTLPQVKSLLKDQRVGQAARVVQGLLESARARAIATNRPVALMLERAGEADLTVNNTCLRMSLGEVFPPYEGDLSNSKAVLLDINDDGFIDQIQIPKAEATSLDTLIHEGDMVTLGDRNDRYEITLKTQTPTDFFLTLGPWTTGDQRMQMPTFPTKLPYRIYRAPSKMMSGSVVLPRGACIDLTISGVGLKGYDFKTSSLVGGSIPSSVYLVFSPRGNLESIYYESKSGSQTKKDRNLPNGLVYLLVGRTDQVDPNYNPAIGAATAASATSERDDFKSNFLDPANIWVSINPNSGSVYTSQLAVGSDLSSARRLATQGLTRQGN